MGFFDIFKKKKKMSDGLEKTRTDFFQNIVNTLTSSVIDDDLYNDLEEQLILADVGPSCAVRLVDELRDEVEINGLHTGQEALDALRDIIRREVSPKTDLDLSGKPAVILVVGVNGVGKTTTIAKLAYLYKDGTPKGGCIIGVHEKLGLPIRFVGVGEKIDDLIFFSATDFAEALLPEVPQHKKEETEQVGEEQA